MNLGILAHVDAGKTSLTERLLYDAGVIGEVGSVDRGSTQTDTLALERARGITIKAAVVSFEIADVTVNLIDTPGHPDFIAEVERVLSVLDGAVLVVSAVEGVQAQTRVLMRTLERLRIPTVIFVNKIDRGGADPERVLRGIAEKLTQAIVPMGSVSAAGTRAASFVTQMPAAAQLAELLTARDDALLAAYLDGSLAPGRLRHELGTQTRRALVHPVFFGSAITGAGVESLRIGLAGLLPTTRGTDGPVSGAAFKIERGPAGEKIAYVRMFAGTLHVRDEVRYGIGRRGKVTGLRVFERGAAVRRGLLAAGRIGQVSGLDLRVGDRIGAAPSGAQRYFAPPTLSTVVSPVRPAERGILQAALTELAEQDPLINLRQDGELFVSLYGEVQKEVIQATLAAEYGVDVTFRETTTICIERPSGTGEAFEVLGMASNPFLATVGLRVAPAPVGSGVQFRLGVELGSMPAAFFKAVEDTVHDTLRQGLFGWQVADCTVTMTRSGYAPRQSHAHQGFDKSMSSTGADFRGLTPLVLMDALRRAGTRVYEPIHQFRLEIPADTLPAALRMLPTLRAVPLTSSTLGATAMLDGEIPAAHVHSLRRRLPTLTRGEGVLDNDFARYEQVHNAVPTRPRTDQNPLDRKEYLLRVQRRVTSSGSGPYRADGSMRMRRRTKLTERGVAQHAR
ncbi:MAG TPA: translation factor GTPase family protein [Jatrophihabitantaceae bacterium]